MQLTRTRRLAGLLAAVAVLGWQARPEAPTGLADAARPTAGARPVPAPADAAETAALLAQGRVRDYQAWQSFQDRLRQAARAPERLSPAGRAELLAELDRYRAQGRITPYEAALNRLALAKGEGEARYREEAEALVRQAEAERARLAAEASPPEPRFLAYKQREQAIAQEILALPPERLPEGISRDDYLRQRLLQARIDAYRQE